MIVFSVEALQLHHLAEMPSGAAGQAKLDILANKLIEKETLYENEVTELLGISPSENNDKAEKAG